MRKSSSIYRLDPFVDDGLLRVGGRLSRSSMPEETKHPIILPKDGSVSVLLMHQLHENINHSGRSYMLSKLRQRYWIIKANTLARSIINKCVTCRRQRAKIGNQKMADLPADRVTPDEPPFTHVGMDYFGPFEVKQGRSAVKRYGVIFTCLNLRAVHIEIAHTLDTDSCINAILRFIARRGQVKRIRSDNGTNLVGSNRELKHQIEQWNSSKIGKAMQQHHVDWAFNTPVASHQGGVWERQIRTIRKVLEGLLKTQRLDDESLRTLMCEVEATINGRPITRVSDDPDDLEALTPNHLLLLKVKPNLPPGVFDERDNYTRRRWKQVQYLADLFWKRWTKEYLPELQARQRWCTSKVNFSVGDVVLVVDSSAPRNSWPLGRIAKTFPNNDGHVRRVLVKTQTSALERPVAKLCQLLEAKP